MNLPDSGPWIGVFLEGTLARWHSQDGEIGDASEDIVAAVRSWIDYGLRVKVVTPRVYIDCQGSDCVTDRVRAASDQRQAVQEWLVGVGLPRLEVVCGIDRELLSLYGDRCVQTLATSGYPLPRPRLPDPRLQVEPLTLSDM